MYDDFGGPGFDWNGNGRHDSFDSYMDMKAADSSSHNKTNSSNGNKPDNRRVIYDSRKDSDGIALFKAILVCVFCLGGIFLPVSAGAGSLGTAICMLGAVGLSIAVLKI